jgi:hypothetical protein
VKARCQICKTELDPEALAPGAPDDLAICPPCWQCCEELGLMLGEAVARGLALLRRGPAVSDNGSGQ